MSHELPGWIGDVVGVVQHEGAREGALGRCVLAFGNDQERVGLDHRGQDAGSLGAGEPGFEAVSGVGQEAFQRPGMDQFCARGARYSACVTLMPMAPFPGGKKPSPEQIKAALATLL